MTMTDETTPSAELEARAREVLAKHLEYRFPYRARVLRRGSEPVTKERAALDAMLAFRAEADTARVAAAVEAERGRCARIARGQYASVSKYDERSVFYGSDLSPDRSEFGRGVEKGRELAATAIRQSALKREGGHG